MYYTQSESPSMITLGVLVFFERLLFSWNDVRIASSGMLDGVVAAHEPNTVAARTDSSDSEWRCFETVKPP